VLVDFTFGVVDPKVSAAFSPEERQQKGGGLTPASAPFEGRLERHWSRATVAEVNGESINAHLVFHYIPSRDNVI
jgi:hypothetical protein